MDYNTMDQYTFKVSRCDWDCLTSALMNKCDLGSRKLPTCQQASLRCEDTGGCDIQCDDTTKRNMPPIENDGLKTFLKERRILCRRAEAWVITSRCEECDIELKTMRLRLPKKRERLACGTVQEMLDQNLIQFDCIYKVCDCQEEDNRLIANCKVTNIETTNNGNGNANIEEGPQEAPETTTTTLHFTTPQNMKKGKRNKSPKNKKNASTTASTTSKVSSSTKTGKKKEKGQNSSKKDEESESEHDDTTTSGSKKDKKKKKGNNNNENTTSMSVTSRNSREQTFSGSDQVTGAVEPASTTAGQKKTKGKKKKGKDNGESTTSSITGRDHRRKGYGRRCHVNENGTSIETTDINVTSGTTTIASQTAVHRGGWEFRGNYI
ncbi:cylicin-2-like [Argopecten irradians]|uniref:cylicin-2-like n=1 Tax=Argopecten irradians TaxID=31199 RepID=UPI00371FDA8E